MNTSVNTDLNLLYVNYHSLENEGYSRCPGTVSNFKHGASNLFQKRFKKNEKTLYFINVYEFDFTEFQNDGRYPKDMPVLKYQAEVRFYRREQEFDVELFLTEKTSIKDMERFFDEVYQKMNCDPDHHNQ